MTRRPRPERRCAAICTALALSITLAGCGAAVGFGLPTLSTDAAASASDGAGAEIEDVSGSFVESTNGCLYWDAPGTAADGAWIVWPAGFGAADGAVTRPDGTVLASTAALSGRGAVVALDGLPQGEDDQSYFGSFGRFCGADARGALVMTEVR